MIEIGLAVVGALRIFTFIVGVIKGILFVEHTFEKLITNNRTDFLVHHVYEDHQTPIAYCIEAQCADL